MHHLGFSCQITTLVTTVAIAVGGVSLAVPHAVAAEPTPKTTTSASTDPASLCRKVKQPSIGLVIRSQPTTNSNAVGDVAQYQNVTVTTNPANSQKDSAGRIWVQISAPKAGWVSYGMAGQEGNLGYCDGVPTPPVTENPPTSGSLCRRVISPSQGLVIRDQAATAGGRVGGVGLGERVTLSSSPATSSRDSSGRYWVKVSAPAAGWVSNGYPGASHLGMCP